MSFISNNIDQIRDRISRACAASGRNPSEVTLLAVTKTISASIIGEALAAGVSDFGENRFQELLPKVAELPSTIRWHMIGHLQGNKVNVAVPIVHRIQSVDSLKLMELLNRAAAENHRVLPVFLQVNVSREPQKHGFSENELGSALDFASTLKNICVDGLMTIAEFSNDATIVRTQFAALRNLRDTLCPPHWHLSMGMSHDFENAILEGSTFVRIGSAIFGDRTHAPYAN